jgi:hypothetical protein
MDYVKATSAGTTRIQVVQHIVEGDHVATMSENEMGHGRLPVFARFRIAAGLIEDVRVFYDPRLLSGPPHED